MIESNRAKKIINNAKNKNVLACGDVMLDAYLKGEVERFSQEAPVPVIPVTEEQFFPGGAGNAAACMSAVEIIPYLVSVVGSKERISYSNILKEECAKAGIVPYFEIDDERRTTLKMRLAAIKTTSQHVARVDMEDIHPLSSSIERNVISQIKNIVKDKNISIISIHDYKKGFLTEMIFKTLMEISQKNKIPVFADLKQETFVKLKNLILAPELFYLKPNKDESVQTAKLINGFNKNGNTDEEITEIAEIIQKEIPIHIIITRGKKGAVLFERNKEPYFVKLNETEEQFDVAGAGDTVEAFLISSYLGGATMEEALEIAVASSQIAIRKFGTSIVTEDELINWLQAHDQ